MLLRDEWSIYTKCIVNFIEYYCDDVSISFVTNVVSWGIIGMGSLSSLI